MMPKFKHSPKLRKNTCGNGNLRSKDAEIRKLPSRGPLCVIYKSKWLKLRN